MERLGADCFHRRASEIVLHHATEGYRIADELARRKVPVSLTLVDSPGGKLEAAGLLEENAAILDKAGVNVAINTDDFITESRFFLRTGAIAVRGGMSEDAALRALTIRASSLGRRCCWGSLGLAIRVRLALGALALLPGVLDRLALEGDHPFVESEITLES